MRALYKVLWLCTTVLLTAAEQQTTFSVHADTGAKKRVAIIGAGAAGNLASFSLFACPQL
jgi:NADPH-dependent glutamate synthase beta subunit-like oxidoreductase